MQYLTAFWIVFVRKFTLQMLLHSHVWTLNSFWQRNYIFSTLFPCGKCGGRQSYKRLRIPREFHKRIMEWSSLCCWGWKCQHTQTWFPSPSARLSSCTKLLWHFSLPSKTQSCKVMCLESDFVHNRADTRLSLWKQHLHVVGQHIIDKARRNLAECTTGTNMHSN